MVLLLKIIGILQKLYKQYYYTSVKWMMTEVFAFLNIVVLHDPLVIDGEAELYIELFRGFAA